MNSDIEDDIMDPVMQCTTLPSHSSFSQKKLVSFVTEIHTTSIDFLTPKHPSDTYVFTVKMEILLEPTSNKLLVIRWWRYPIPAEVGFITTCSCSKTYYKHQDSRILKAQDLKTKTFTNSDIKDLPLRYQVYQGRLLTSFQDDAKYEHQVQVNTKFLNALLPEWRKFVTDVKLAKSLYTTNYDQLYAYLSQHERYANEALIMRERYLDPLALVSTSKQSTQNVFQSHKLGNHSRLQSHRSTSSRKTKSEFCWHWKPMNCYNLKGKLCSWSSKAFQTEDLDSYDSDCDDISSAKAVLMANISSCYSDVLSEVPYFDTYLNDMINQDVQDMSYSEQTHIMDFLVNEITSDSNIILYSQYLQESQDAGI
ncbi:hypothetical protein Tco_0633148 [Tanacetum coccineum]